MVGWLDSTKVSKMVRLLVDEKAGPKDDLADEKAERMVGMLADEMDCSDAMTEKTTEGKLVVEKDPMKGETSGVQRVA